MTNPSPSKLHTPGPWRYSEVLGGCWVYASDQREVLAYKFSPDAQNRANARLVGAAPELLDALEELVDIVQGALDDINLHGLGMDSFTLQPAREAIKKARGE